MDLNIEQQGFVSGWEPPAGAVLSPGFKATRLAISDAIGYSISLTETKTFIDKLEEKGYCIALLPSEET